jgi:drug/metabolite transporter (DMT)-like permease
MKNMSRVLARPSSNQVLFGSSLVVLSSVFYGSYGIWTRLMGSNFGPFMQAWIRAALVIAVLLPIALKTRRWQPVRWRADKAKLGVFVVVNSLISASQYYATIHIGIGLTLLTLYAGYLMSMFLFGWMFNGERYTVDKLAATILALLGLALTFTPSLGHTELLPFLAALLAGVGIGAEMVTVQKFAYDSVQTTILAWATGMVGSVPLAFILHEHAPGLHMYAQWGYVLIFVVACIASSWLSFHGAQLVEAGVVGILGLLEVVWGLVFGVLFFSERPALLAYIGASCILAAAAIPYLKELKKAKLGVIEEIPV